MTEDADDDDRIRIVGIMASASACHAEIKRVRLPYDPLKK